MEPVLQAKRDRLIGILRDMRRAAVAFSGGVDSAAVAWAAHRALGAAAVAVTADSPSVPRAEVAAARRIAAEIGIRHEVVSTSEFDDPAYLKNDGARCYFCKSALYDAIAGQLHRWNAEAICSGANVDDLGDYRPGLKAAAERAVRHPLVEAGIDKADVRAIARHEGISIWDKPASPCLSSRLAPGVAVTVERTARVEAAEKILKELGLADCRVRLHEGELARIEVPSEAIPNLAFPEVRDGLSKQLKALGFRFVTLDLEGLRSGSMNQLVPLSIRGQFAFPTSRVEDSR